MAFYGQVDKILYIKTKLLLTLHFVEIKKHKNGHVFFMSLFSIKCNKFLEYLFTKYVIKVIKYR